MKLIEEILCHEPRGILSLTGGGGKTSLLFHLARQLARAGKRVMTTTTTKIFFPDPGESKTVLLGADPESILKQVRSLGNSSRHITAAAGHLVETDKLMGFPPSAIGIFMGSGMFDWILVEADGAARRPVKAPAEHEPVIPADTGVVVAVAGLDALGEPLSEEIVFRSSLAGPLMGLAPGETITGEALARLLAHPNGSFKGSPPHARRFIFLNKADTPGRLESGSGIAGLLREMDAPIAEALIIGQALDGVQIHAVHPLKVIT